jgi:cytochrome c556
MTVALAAFLGLAAAGAALAQDTPPTTPGGKAVLVRQAHYKDLNKTFGSVGAELRKETPDKAAIAAASAAAATLAKDLPGWFPKGSGPEAGVKTAAKAEIWTDAAGFASAVTRLQDETAKLQQAAAGGDMDAIKAQFRATAGACKNCHDQYRAALDAH